MSKNRVQFQPGLISCWNLFGSGETRIDSGSLAAWLLLSELRSRKSSFTDQ